MNKYLPPFLGLLLSTLTGCAQKTFDEKVNSLLRETVPVIRSEELMPIKDSVVLLDARQPVEYETSHIKGARFVNYDAFKKKDVDDIPKDAHIVVYCAIGYRSERIGEELQKMGYNNVKNLYGGIFDWKNKDNDVVDTKGMKTDSVHTYSKSWSKWLYKGIKVYE